VQLDSQHSLSLALPPGIGSDAASTTKLFALIGDEEGKYQTALNDTYHDMGEKTFKGLRRALPLTRQKVSTVCKLPHLIALTR
jgi:capping protein alpha